MAGKRAVKKDIGFEQPVLKSDLKTYKRFFTLSNNFFCIMGLDGYFKLVNPAFQKLLGYSLKEIYSRPFLEFIHPEDRNIAPREITPSGSGERITSCRKRYRCKDGSYRFLGWTLYTDFNEGLMYASAHDITERINLEEQIRAINADLEKLVRKRTLMLNKTNKKLESEIAAHVELGKVLKEAKDNLRKSKNEYRRLSQEFRVLLDAIPDNILLLDPDMKIIWANTTAAARFNRETGELTGHYCYELCCGIFSPCKNCPAIKSYLTGSESTSIFKSPSGLVWDIRSFPIKNNAGQVKNIIELARDITAKVQMEEEAKALQMRLLQANKMTSLGTLVSGIIHEINNPNSFIISNSRLIKKTWKDNRKILEEHYRTKGDFVFGGLPYSEMRKIMPQVIKAVNEGPARIHKIVSNLRDFVRPRTSADDVRVNINDVVKTARTIINHQIKKHTNSFHLMLGKNIPPLRGNSQQLEQVLMNLMMNSLQALSNKRQGVWVSTSLDRKSRMIVIQVRDEGSGIPENAIGRIIDPFFTTKSKTGGTGLGLSISYNIIKEHSGLLEFRSEEGKGTTATIKLPAAENK